MTLKTGIMNEYNDTVFLIDAKSLLEVHEKYYNSTLSVFVAIHTSKSDTIAAATERKYNLFSREVIILTLQ